MRRTKVERSMMVAFGEGRMAWDIRTKCEVQGRCIISASANRVHSDGPWVVLCIAELL